MKYAFWTILVLVRGCGGEPTIPDTGAPRAEAPTATGDSGTPRTLLPELNVPVASSEELALYFPDYAVDLLTEFQRRFVAVQTESDLARVYDAALGLDQRTLGEIEFMPFVESELPVAGLTPACVAECTEPAWLMDMADWRAAARHIESPAAMAFFDALGQLYDYPTLYNGRIAAYPSHFERTWDYGGYSLLGSGRHTSLLSAFARATSAGADAAQPDPGPFARYAEEYRQSILTDARVQSCIGPSAADARTELLQLGLDERAEAFANPAANRIQAGCASAQCTCIDG